MASVAVRASGRADCRGGSGGVASDTSRPAFRKGAEMVERSPELEQVMRNTIDAMERSDIEWVEQRTSHDDCVVGIGSDPSEWSKGFDETLRLWSESMPDATLQVHAGLDDVEAFREGGVGWAAGRGWFDVEGRRVPVRMTAVLHQEDGDWKIVQTHASIGVPNDRMFDPMLQPGGAV